jgi:hypothetical protein
MSDDNRAESSEEEEEEEEEEGVDPDDIGIKLCKYLEEVESPGDFSTGGSIEVIRVTKY